MPGSCGGLSVKAERAGNVVSAMLPHQPTVAPKVGERVGASKPSSRKVPKLQLPKEVGAITAALQDIFG